MRAEAALSLVLGILLSGCLTGTTTVSGPEAVPPWNRGSVSLTYSPGAACSGSAPLSIDVANATSRLVRVVLAWDVTLDEQHRGCASAPPRWELNATTAGRAEGLVPAGAWSELRLVFEDRLERLFLRDFGFYAFGGELTRISLEVSEEATTGRISSGVYERAMKVSRREVHDAPGALDGVVLESPRSAAANGTETHAFHVASPFNGGALVWIIVEPDPALPAADAEGGEERVRIEARLVADDGAVAAERVVEGRFAYVRELVPALAPGNWTLEVTTRLDGPAPGVLVGSGVSFAY